MLEGGGEAGRQRWSAHPTPGRSEELGEEGSGGRLL